MLDSSEAKLGAVYVHRVGNRFRQEAVQLSEERLALDKRQTAALLAFFFNHFEKTDAIHRLFHPVGQELNSIHAVCTRCFDGGRLAVESKRAAEHLYDVSKHPKINAGYLYIAQLRGIRFEGRECDAIGFFKSDHFDEFINVDVAGGASAFTLATGTRVKSFDKGALVFNLDRSDGYRVLQAVSHSDEAQFWTEQFLKTEQIDSSKTQTKEILDACKRFSKTLDITEDPTSRVDFLNASYNYLSEAERFKTASFLSSIPPQYKDRFADYIEHERTEKKLTVPDSFKIDSPIVQKRKAYFRSTIILDGRVEIKISPQGETGTADLIERGYDPQKRRHFYKFYFTEES